MSKAQVWVVAKTITSCLNLVVSSHVMNQYKDHWLLLNVVTTSIALTMNMEATLLPFFGGPNFFDSFENEILVLHKNM
jgi:hypothetical protein